MLKFTLSLLCFVLISEGLSSLSAGHAPPKKDPSSPQHSLSEPLLPLTPASREGLLKLDSGPWTRKHFVEVQKVCPGIFVDLRYATTSNFTQQIIYPQDFPCLVRVEVAHALNQAQKRLNAQGFALKIWDAWRPAQAQLKLWNAKPDPNYVSDPRVRRSQHSNGVAIDVTLVDLQGQPVPMPSDFDDFTRAAYFRYQGPDPVIQKNLVRLQKAMIESGFRVYDLEWWHFTHKELLTQRPPHLSPSDVGITFPSR